MHDRTVWIEGAAGRLEARWRVGEAPTQAAALLLHPHPLYGGSLHNKTLFRIAKRLTADLRIPNLRFNFRGVGQSEGRHDGGPGEVEDARCALRWLREQVGELPIHVIGYSFGAAIGLRGLLDQAGVARRITLGLPLRMDFDLQWFLDSPLPGLCVQGEQDEFGDCVALRRFLDAARAPLELVCIPGAGHLFQGHEDAAVDAVLRYIGRTPS